MKLSTKLKHAITSPEEIAASLPLLLPKLIEKLDSVDMFYHDSDHKHDHMMFEFEVVRPLMTKGSLVVADDIAWNSSLWDFADRLGVPSYNYKGAVGVAFL